MGNTLTHLYSTSTGRGRKRKHDEPSNNSQSNSESSDREDEDSISDSDRSTPPPSKSRTVDIHTPKRKHIKSTSKYIYETLFVKGENSDVTIRALNHDFHLHRHYLKQSGYFSGMLSGSWKESQQDVIKLDIPDDNIDTNALKIAFGCLYKDDVVLKPVDVIGVLAAATLLQLDGLIRQCIDFMKETIGASTVVTYMTACQMYSLPDLATFCKDWMLHNVMAPCNLAVLKDISEDLMPVLVSSGDLWVLQVEMDLYTLLKKWIFLRNNPTWSGRRNQLMPDTDAFFKRETGEQYFLQTGKGKKYIKSFEALRWQYVVNDLASVRLIEGDRVVPKEWLDPVYRLQWQHFLTIEQGLDKGPHEVEDQVFITRAMRCGRILPSDKEFCWRWVGYNFGIDSLVSYKSRLITLMRNNSSSMNFPGCVSLQPKRYMFIRLTVSNINEKGAITATKSTGIKKICLDKNESVVLMTVDSHFKFPLYITQCSLLTTPSSSLPLPCLRVILSDNCACQTSIRPRKSSSSCKCRGDTVTDVSDTDVAGSVIDTTQSEESSEDEASNMRLSPRAESLLAYLRRSGSSGNVNRSVGDSSS